LAGAAAACVARSGVARQASKKNAAILRNQPPTKTKATLTLTSLGEGVTDSFGRQLMQAVDKERGFNTTVAQGIRVIWSEEKNNYYFLNPETGVTAWSSYDAALGPAAEVAAPDVPAAMTEEEKALEQALDREIAELTKKIAGMDKDMKDAQEKWDIEHKVFLAVQASMAGAIQACESALKVLKASKGAMGGDTELNAADMEKEPFDVWKPNTYGNITMVDVKKYGAAGTLAYVFTELAFWAVAVPTECAVFYQTAGRWPDFSNDMDKAAVLGFVFAASNIARLCLPLRFGAALAMAPWVDANIMKRFQGSSVADS